MKKIRKGSILLETVGTTVKPCLTALAEVKSQLLRDQHGQGMPTTIGRSEAAEKKKESKKFPGGIKA